ncbi:hypothetical protein FZEAL_2795 [Fusarium zealandicum]|uniref:Lea domain protein n=1 Tax=Fusarium zealandicum TaxID=1053134 RepID=A0A8H4UPX9_9HYPO|nr:hypothetical protein FZEAL_2795 [Fusarium zealandicum]
MSSSPKPSTPEGDPTHSTYQVNVPVRNARGTSSEDPNPEIRIPSIKSLSSSDGDEQSTRSPEDLAAGLDGKYVDEFGNILDWDGTVLGRVEGDLPSMIGRPVTASGQVLDVDGEVVGHVCDNYIKPDLKPLVGGLKVDDEGSIYDEQGNVVGQMNKPASGGGGGSGTGESKDNNGEKGAGGGAGGGGGGPGTHPRPFVAPRPDELYLDVKSTFDGIQLIIKIPTVFNRDRVSENSDSSAGNR